MSDWSKKMAEYLRQQKTEKDREDAKFLEIQRLKKEHGRTIWNRVSETIKDNCGDLNRDMEASIVEITDQTYGHVDIQAGISPNHRKLHCTFSPEQSLLSWSISDGKKGSYQLGVSREGQVDFYLTNEKGESLALSPSSPVEIAETILDALLKG